MDVSKSEGDLRKAKLSTIRCFQIQPQTLECNNVKLKIKPASASENGSDINNLELKGSELSGIFKH